jgi:hypothetical protein
MIAEPEVVAPERVFEMTIVEVVRDLVREARCGCLVVPKFGLDVALFLRTSGGGAYSRFLEVKVYAAGRPGGLGFGTPKGTGPQVELLLNTEQDLRLVDDAVRWVLADATRAKGSARYALFDSRRAKSAAMNGVSKGKQNNLRMSALAVGYITWPSLVKELRQFLFAPVGQTS